MDAEAEAKVETKAEVSIKARCFFDGRVDVLGRAINLLEHDACIKCGIRPTGSFIMSNDCELPGFAKSISTTLSQFMSVNHGAAARLVWQWKIKLNDKGRLLQRESNRFPDGGRILITAKVQNKTCIETTLELIGG